MPSSGALLGSAVFVATILVVVPASADDAEGDRARCAASYESAQVLRRDEHLEAARTQLLICQSTCPPRLVGDCTNWLRDVKSLTPTVRLVARDSGGQEVTDALVTVDGRLVDARESAVAIEPGAHVFRFERRGVPAAEVRAELHAGERERVIAVVLSPSAPAPARESAPPASRTARFESVDDPLARIAPREREEPVKIAAHLAFYAMHFEDTLSVGENGEARDRVLELAHVPRPVVTTEQRQRARWKIERGARRDLGREKSLHEELDVVSSLAQRGHARLEDR